MTAVSSAAAVAGLSAATSIAVEALKATLAAEQAVIQRLIAPSVETGRGQVVDMLA